MKKIIILFLIIFLFLNCNLIQYMDVFENFKFNEDIEFKNEIDVYNWVSSHCEYRQDTYDDWKSPQQTFSDKYGDCEDLVILMMAIYYQKFNKGSELWVVDTKGDLILNHAVWVVDNHIVLDITSIYNSQLTLKYNMKEVNNILFFK